MLCKMQLFTYTIFPHGMSMHMLVKIHNVLEQYKQLKQHLLFQNCKLVLVWTIFECVILVPQYIIDFDYGLWSQVVLTKTCSAFSLCSGCSRSYWEGTNRCTANQEGKRKKTINLFATRHIGFWTNFSWYHGWFAKSTVLKIC